MTKIKFENGVEQAMHEIAKFHYVLAEGRKGHHLLFSADMIRKAFSRNSTELAELFRQNLSQINDALNQTFTVPTFEEKQKFVSELAPDIRDAMIFGYFQILEGLEAEGQGPIVH